MQTSVRVLQKRLRRSSGQGARFEEGLFLFLVLLDELGDEGDLVVVVAGVAGQPVVLALVLAFQAVKDGADLKIDFPC